MSIIYTTGDLHQLAANGAGSDPIIWTPFAQQYSLFNTITL